jgi:hypothetical protein
VTFAGVFRGNFQFVTISERGSFQSSSQTPKLSLVNTLPYTSPTDLFLKKFLFARPHKWPKSNFIRAFLTRFPADAPCHAYHNIWWLVEVTGQSEAAA